MFRILFKLCVGFLLLLGRVFHFSYEKIAVIFNLYIQGTILMCSGVLPFMVSLYAVGLSPTILHSLLLMVTLMYATLYMAGWYLMFKHYPPRWGDSFNQCVYDLQRLRTSLHVSYVVLNLIIFVLWWLTLLFINLFLSYCIIQG